MGGRGEREGGRRGHSARAEVKGGARAEVEDRFESHAVRAPHLRMVRCSEARIGRGRIRIDPDGE